MKAIYTKIKNKYYRINQDTKIPTAITARVPGANSSVRIDTNNKIITQYVSVNTLRHPGTKTNRELVNKMKEELLHRCVTEIDTIPNFYKIHIDYSIFVEGCEIDHNVQIKPIQHSDVAILLGIGTNDEDVFRRVKSFHTTVDLRMRNKVPYGVTAKKNSDVILKINDVSIYQATKEQSCGCAHQSIYETPFSVNSSTVRSDLDEMIMVYSSNFDGVEFEDLNIPFVPNKVELIFDMILTNFMVVYDNKTIEEILKYNLEQKYEPDIDTGLPLPDPPFIIPDPDPSVAGDGSMEPDEDGYSEYYERCQRTTPKGLLVVEDAISDGDYIVGQMIRKRKVIKDIPDITVGEYVIHREVIQYDNF